MKYTPMNGHVQIQPIKEGGVVQREQTKYDEKGTVIGWDDDLTAIPYFNLTVGDIVYFDGWLAAKYNQDTDDEVWFVKYEDIRGKEIA